MTATRLALAAGAAGLAGGLALGITGFASAADPAPTPSPGSGSGTEQRADRPFRQHHVGGRPGMGMGKHRGGGLVVSVSAGSVTVRTPDGTRTVGLSGDTSYYVGRTEATRAALKEGLVVAIRLVDPRADKPVAGVVRVVPAHLAGWVTDVDGSTVTVTDRSGFTRRVRVDGDTVYVKDGGTATRSVVVDGAFIRATGEVADDGTTLEADRVAVGRSGERPADGPAREPRA